MKIICRAIPLVLLATFFSSMSLADGGYSFGFSIERKKLDGERKQINSTTVTKEKWAYKVTMENKSFKDVSNIEIKYLMFMKPESAGEVQMLNKIKLKRKQGSTTVPMIKNFDKFEFTTDSMELTSTQLEQGYVWASGANPRATDALKGLWMRVFVDGKQVSEYIDPPSLKDKEKW